jgi:hypothetical protein
MQWSNPKTSMRSLQLTAKTFGGAAAARANTFEFRMKRLGIAFDEAKETLGTALMPALEELFQMMITKVIPAIQTFLAENGDKLVAVMTRQSKPLSALDLHYLQSLFICSKA